METDAPQLIEDNAVPEKPINPLGTQKKGKVDDQTDQSSMPSWQPLEPKPEANEDLASILQAEFNDPHAGQEDNTLFPSNFSGHAALVIPDMNSEQPSTSHDQPSDLAALAATVFDTTFYLVPRSNKL